MIRRFTHHHNLFQFLRVCSVVSLEDLNFQRTGRNFLIKDGLRIEWTVMITNTCMVTANNKVGCAHVLTEYSVQYTLTWASIKHIETVTSNHCTVFREVQLDHLTDRSITNRRRDISFFQFTKQHVNNQAIT